MALAEIYINFTTEVPNKDRPFNPWEDAHPMMELHFTKGTE